MSSEEDGWLTPTTPQRAKKMPSKKCCSYSDCSKWARRGGKCIQHGGGRSCASLGCTQRVLTNGKCFKHGGGTICCFPECSKLGIIGGRCFKHGGGARCSVPGCDKRPSRGKCLQHGGGNRCTQAGCSKRAKKKEGLCATHGEDYRCSYSDCSMFAAQGGLCPKHNEGSRCSYPRCREPIWANAKCYDHSQVAGTDGFERGPPPRTRSGRATNTGSGPGLEVKGEEEATSDIGPRTRSAQKKSSNTRPPASSDELAVAKTSRPKRKIRKQDSKATKSTGKTENMAPLNFKATRKRKRTANTQQNPRRSKRRCVVQQQQTLLLETDDVQPNTESPGAEGASTNDEMNVKVSKTKQDQPTPDPMANIMPTNRYDKAKLPETKQNQPSPEPVTDPTLTSDNEEAIELELVCETGDEQQSSDSETESATTSDNEEPVELGLVSEADDEKQNPTDEDLSNADRDDNVDMELVSGAAEEQLHAESKTEDTPTDGQEEEEVELELVSVMGVLIPIAEVPDYLRDTLTGETQEPASDDDKDNDAVVSREEDKAHCDFNSANGKESTLTDVLKPPSTETEGDLSDKSRNPYRGSTKHSPSQQKNMSPGNPSDLNKFCSHAGCTKQVKVVDKCDTHGKTVYCCHPECTNRALTEGTCFRHGGGRKCSFGGCQKRADTGGKCKRHGGGTRCSHSKCNKHVKINGMCIAHSGTRVCSNPGCRYRARLDSKCLKHCRSASDTTESKVASGRIPATRRRNAGRENDEILPRKTEPKTPANGRRQSRTPKHGRNTREEATEPEDDQLLLALQLSKIEY